MISRRKILKGGAAAAAIVWVPFIGARRAFAQSAAPFDYFISPNGDDNNPGTLASPWSITAFNSKSSTYSGKRVGIIGDVAGVQTPIQFGTVGGAQTTLYSKLNSQANQPILNINGGNSSSSTYVASCTSAGVYQRGWAIIDPSNPSDGTHATLDAATLMGQNGNTSSQVPNPDNITYDGLTIRNFSYCAIAEESAGATFINVVIQNCEFYGSTTSVSSNNPGAIRLQATSGAQILNCKFHDCQNASGSNFGPYAYPGVMSYSSNALTITNCTFYNIVSVQQKDGSQDAVISYCYLDAGTFGVYGGNSYGTSYYEGTNASGRTTTMHHNICLGMIWNQNATGAAYSGNWQFYNNTCYPNSSNPIFYLNPGAGSTFHSYNNILYPQSSWGAEYGAARFAGASALLAPQWDYNYYHTAPTFNTGSMLSYALWQALGFDAHSHSGGSPFSATPSAQVPTSFSLNTSSAAYTGGVGGAICGAIDGSGTVGCNFSSSPVLVPAAPKLSVS